MFKNVWLFVCNCWHISWLNFSGLLELDLPSFHEQLKAWHMLCSFFLQNKLMLCSATLYSSEQLRNRACIDLLTLTVDLLTLKIHEVILVITKLHCQSEAELVAKVDCSWSCYKAVKEIIHKCVVCDTAFYSGYVWNYSSLCDVASLTPLLWHTCAVLFFDEYYNFLQ